MAESSLPLRPRTALPRESNYFQSIVDFASDAILVLDIKGCPIHLNRSFVKMWGVDEDIATARDERLMAQVTLRLNNPRAFLSRLEAAAFDPVGERMHLKDGRVMHSVVSPLMDDGIVVGQVWNFRDITDRLAEAGRTQRALYESEQRFRSLVENASDLITVVDLGATILYQSPSSERVLGYAADGLVGTRFTDLVHFDDIPAVRGLIEEATGNSGQAAQREIRLRHSAGSWLYLEISARDRRLDPGIGGLVFNAHDVTARHLLEGELIRQANHDPLTSLLNRRGFVQELENILKGSAQDRQPAGALLLFDVDEFKDVNDSLGHQAGDHVLAELSSLLSHELRASATVARLGGDEFAVLIRGASLVEAEKVSTRLLTAIRGHTFETPDGSIVDITASLGLVAFPRDGSTVDELMSRVDLALYEAKAQGRNRANSYEHQGNLEAKAEARLMLRHQIRGALKEQRLMVFGQPILDLRSRVVTHHEMLLRMKQKNGRVLAAKDFIDFAERSGMIVPIDGWVLSQTLALLAAQEVVGGDQVLSVNLSARALADNDVQAWIEAKLKSDCKDATRLVIEVTETAAITDIDNAERFMRRLKDIGCRFALDDFGVGFSSLQRLRRLPVDYLKIDGSFIRAITRSVEDQALVQSIVTVARALHMETIAEFVETSQQLEMVRDLGVDYAQGHFVGKPRSMNGIWPLTAQVRAA